MAANPEDISLKRCIDYANDVIELCGLHIPRISSVQDINSNLFVSLFERITNHAVPDLLLSEDSVTDAHNIQSVINTISLDLLGLSLSHITGEDIVSGNVVSIINLLEVLEAMFAHDKEDESCDVPASEKRSKPSSTTDGHVTETVTLVKSSLEDEENIPPAIPPVLNRKTCKNTLNKLHNHHQHHIPKKPIDHAASIPKHSKRKVEASSNLKPVLKRRNSRPVQTVLKKANIEDIEDLQKSNFELKVKALLVNDKSPVMLAGEVRRKYIQSLKAPLKVTSIPPCRKSFLLPHNLRSKSKSPVRQHPIRRKTSSKKQKVKSQLYENIRTQSEGNVQNGETSATIQSMLKEFPGFQFPENILELLKKHYCQHISSIHKQLKNILLKKPTTVKQTEKAMEEEAKLSKILTKELQEKDHLRKINEDKAIEIRIKASLRDARMQSVKMRQYFEEFHKSMNRKLGKRNFKEEVLIEKTFKKMLDLQKEKVRLLCKRVKEADDYDAVQHRKYLDALKNVYQEQLDLLADSVNSEQKELFEREKAKRLATDKMNREILKTLQMEVRSLQKDVLEMMEDIHFRELDAENFIENCHLQDL